MDPFQAQKGIVYTNIVLFGITLLLNPMGTTLSMNPLRFLTPDLGGLLLMGATGTLPIDQFGRWWTLLSANYLHGGLLHIVFNMMALNQLWGWIVSAYGLSRAFTIYTVGGVVGFYLSYLAGVSMTIGASAALCGLMGAALYYGKSRGGLYGRIIHKQIGGWVLGLFLFGIVVPGINNWGHGGGLLAGIGAGYLLGHAEKNPETAVHRWLGAFLAVGTVGVILYAVATALVFRWGG